MAEKTVTVRLKAVIDQYQKAMKTAGDTTASAAQKADAFKKLGQNTADLGDRLTRNVTLPIIAVGAAATKMSMDFDKTFVNMQSLAGVAGDEIGKMKEQVLDLAGETGKAPQELAEALYFLRSSGLDASDAMDALEVSAKGSAAGLGDTVAVADAVSSAMNAYAKSNLTAAEATDVMVATAREGKAEPAELAAQMGRLLPLASELGITFQDVGAGLAALSLSGNDAAAASTLLSNIMAKLLKPSQQAMELMDAVGIELGDIRSMIQERGLLGTLELLRAELGDSGFTRFLEDAQAVQGGLALTGENVEKNREIFESLGDSVGATDEAFGKWAESMGAKNARAWAEFQAAMIRLGDTIAPLAADLIGMASDLLEWFDKLPGPVKQLSAVLVVAAAAAGPFLSAFGRVTSLASGGMKLGSSFLDWASGMNAFGEAMNRGSTSAGKMSGGLSRLKGAAGLAGIAVAVAGVGFALNEHFNAKNEAAIAGIADSFANLGDEIDSAAKKEVETLVHWNRADDVFSKLVETNRAAAERFLETAEAVGLSADSADEWRDKLEQQADAERQAAKDSEANAEAVEEVTGAYDEETRAVNAAVEALGAYSAALKAQFDPLFGVLNAANGVRDARLGVEEATAKLSEAEKEYGVDSAEAAAATRDLEAAHGSAVEAAYAFEQAQADLATAVENGDVKLEDAIGMLQRWVEQGYITQEEADITADKFRFSAGAVEGYSDSIRRVPTSTTTDIHVNSLAAREGISTVHGDLNRLDGRTATVYVTIHGKTSGELLAGYGVKPPGRAVGGPVYKGAAYEVGEAGREIFVPDQDGTIIPNHMLSKGGSMTSGWSLSGGGVTHNHFDLSGAMIASERDALRWLNQATAKAQRVRA